MPDNRETVCVAADSDGAIALAAKVLQQGGLVAFPTDTVYGVGALAWDEQAVGGLYRAKQRPLDKAIPLLLESTEALVEVAGPVPMEARRLADRFWPGPLTLVVPRSSRVPDLVTAGGDNVALRVPDHPVALALLGAVGSPLAATSANLSGQAAPLTAQDVVGQLGGRIDLILDGGPCPGGVPSTVALVSPQGVQILRRGPLNQDVLSAVLEG